MRAPSRSKNVTALSRRRARRPDGRVYRLTRRISNGRRERGVPPWVWIAIAVFVVGMLILWWWRRH